MGSILFRNNSKLAANISNRRDPKDQFFFKYSKYLEHVKKYAKSKKMLGYLREFFLTPELMPSEKLSKINEIFEN